MRELKFRAMIPNRGAAKEPGQPIKPFVTVYFNFSKVFIDCNYTRNLLALWLDLGNVPDQYTGLKDKNGKEVYEGDIVRVKHTTLDENKNVVDRYMVCEIIFEEGSFELYPTEGRCVYITDEMEIIGNIHERPHLLKEEPPK